MIIDFTRDEEAKYQAMLTSKEVQSFLSEPPENRSRPSSKASNKKEERSGSNSEKGKKKKGILFFPFNHNSVFHSLKEINKCSKTISLSIKFENFSSWSK